MLQCGAGQSRPAQMCIHACYVCIHRIILEVDPLCIANRVLMKVGSRARAVHYDHSVPWSLS